MTTARQKLIDYVQAELTSVRTQLAMWRDQVLTCEHQERDLEAMLAELQGQQAVFCQTCLGERHADCQMPYCPHRSKGPRHLEPGSQWNDEQQRWELPPEHPVEGDLGSTPL